MINPYLILNSELKNLSKIGFDKIHILDVIEIFPKNSQDDDYNVMTYMCKCHVEKEGVFSFSNISLELIKHEMKKGIYFLGVLCESKKQ